MRKADRRAARWSTDLGAVDFNVVALTRASKDVIEHVAGVSERVSPVGDDDCRLNFIRSVSSGFRPPRYVGEVAPRARVLSFGSAAALVVAGAICAALIGGSTGDALAIALITLGLGAALLLIFLEVGLSEERDLAREEERRRQRSADRQRRLRPRRWPRRPG